MHRGRLVAWEEDLQPPAERRTRRAVIKASPGHRRRQRGSLAAPQARGTAARDGAQVLAGLELWGSLNACRGFGMASTGEL